ncbi:MAG: hypothetical protein ACRBCS_04750 [Cellvibrionaceae bacterium]
MATLTKIRGLTLAFCLLCLSLGCSKNDDPKKAENLLKEHKEILDQAKEIEGDIQNALDNRLENQE